MTELEAWKEIRTQIQQRRKWWYGGLCHYIDALHISLTTRRKMRGALLNEARAQGLKMRRPCDDYVWNAENYHPRIRFVNAQIRRLT
jgi:hypothetical protein